MYPSASVTTRRAIARPSEGRRYKRRIAREIDKLRLTNNHHRGFGFLQDGMRYAANEHAL
jgi:hypothetical protein